VSKRILFLAVGALGVSALMTQLTLMRELLGVFSGNELVFGIVLGNWLLLTGIGSVLGKLLTARSTPAGLWCGPRLWCGLPTAPHGGPQVSPTASGEIGPGSGDGASRSAPELERPQHLLPRPSREVKRGSGVFHFGWPLSLFVVAQMLVAVLPLVDVFLLRTLRNVVFLRGAEVGVTATVVSCLVLLAPYCLTTGCLLTLASQLLAAPLLVRQVVMQQVAVPQGSCSDPHGKPQRLACLPDPVTTAQTDTNAVPADSGAASESIGLVYFLDNFGSVVGGLLFNFILIHWFSHFGILCFPALLNLFFAAWVAVLARKRVLAILAAATAVALVAAMALWDFDQLSTEIAQPGQHVVYHGHSPYGSLVVTEAAGQFNFIESGVVLFSTHNIEEVEEAVHYAMAQRPHAGRVLLISGGVSGTAREVLKYGVSAVDYVELDPLILRVAAQYLPDSLADPRIHVINTDGRLFVKQTDRPYDVVIVDVPNPSTSQLNRFYTREFFAEVKQVLAPDGVLCFSLANYEDYLSPELSDLIAVAHRTSGSVFGHVLMLPGGRIFFLASDGPLTAEVARQIEQAGVATRLVNRHYLQAMLSPDRMAEVGRAVRADAAINEDFNPILYYYHLRYWMSHFGFHFGLMEGALLLVLAVYLVRIRPVPLVIFSGGFAASALEVVLLVALQTLNGCLYHQVGLVVTMFMLGLGIGSFVMNRLAPRRPPIDLAKLALAVAVYAACLPVVLLGLGRLGGSAAPLISQVAVPLLTLVLAVLVGLQFPLAGRVDYQGTAVTAARLYAADFIGAALGALLVSTLLIPVMGVAAVCGLSAVMNLFAAATLFVTLKRGGS
jgi:spermidine synthase